MSKLELPKGFLSEETREGFTIPEMMKRVWAVNLEVLTEVSNICERHGIEYYLSWGSLLGAVRHHGFIPWDDDIDIMIKRKDARRLVNIMIRELPNGYDVSSVYNDESHCQPYIGVKNTKNVILDDDGLERFYGCPYICGIDIDMIDNLPPNPEEKEIVSALYNAAYDLAFRYDELSNTEEFPELVEQLQKYSGVTFNDKTSLRNQIWILSENIAAMYSEEECDYYTSFYRIIRGNEDYKLSKACFAKAIKADFEWLKFNIPIGYEEYLEKAFGADYMTPKINMAGHEYPFYKKQQEFIDRLLQQERR